ncbi:hypothetical protein B0T16DRAFT_413498, partial [Cercophora newfieldiana]
MRVLGPNARTRIISPVAILLRCALAGAADDFLSAFRLHLPELFCLPVGGGRRRVFAVCSRWDHWWASCPSYRSSHASYASQRRDAPAAQISWLKARPSSAVAVDHRHYLLGRSGLVPQVWILCRPFRGSRPPAGKSAAPSAVIILLAVAGGVPAARRQPRPPSIDRRTGPCVAKTFQDSAWLSSNRRRHWALLGGSETARGRKQQGAPLTVLVIPTAHPAIAFALAHRRRSRRGQSRRSASPHSTEFLPALAAELCCVRGRGRALAGTASLPGLDFCTTIGLPKMLSNIPHRMFGQITGAF